MKYWYQQPHPQLSACLRTVLVLEGFAPSQDTERPLFTQGMPALLCRMEKDAAGQEQVVRLTLFGRSVPDDCWETDDQTTIVAYFFHPFTAASIFNVSAAALNEKPIDLSDWSPHTINALRIQLAYASATSQKIETLDNLLLHQWNRHQKKCGMIQYATNRLITDSSTEVIANIITELKLNERSFQRMFKKYVGISPSQFRRICQFQLSFTQLRAGQFDNITDVVYDNGFADQSHFIRSFKEFTQTTPHQYLRFGLDSEKQ